MIAIRPQYISIISANFDNPIISQDDQASPISYFNNNVWDLRPYIHNRNVPKSRALIKFSIKLVNNTNLIDICNEGLLLSVKQYLYLRFHIQNSRSGKVLSPQSLIGHFYAITTFVNYLVSRGEKCFSSFTPNDLPIFMNFINTRNPDLANNTISKYLSVIEDLFHFKGQLIDGLIEHPWPDSSIIHISNYRRINGGRSGKQTPRIPDFISTKLFTLAVNYIRTDSPKIINAFTKLEKKVTTIFYKELKKKCISKDYNTFRKDKVEIARAKKTKEYVTYQHSILKKYKFRDKVDLNKSIIKARTCCYIIIALTTGMRNSEIASLTRDSFYLSKGWDDEEYYWLKGFTYKLEDEPKKAKWMVPEIAEVALTHLLAINNINNTVITRSIPFLPLAVQNQQHELKSHLFIGIDLPTNTFTYLSNSRWNECLRLLAKDFDLRTKDIENDLSLEVGSLWPLSSHHFRRTFASLAARSSLGDLRYLREHYKHWSLDMTLHYAKTSVFDDSLFDEVLTERNELQGILVSDWIVNDIPLAGGRGEAIATFRQRGELKQAKDMSGLVKQISNSVFVRGTGHSWCLASGNGCGGEGLYDALQCTDCDNAVIDRSHLPVWKGLKEQHELLLDMPDSGVGTKERAREYIKKSDELINKLN